MSRKGHRARVHESCCNTPSKLIQFCPEHYGAMPIEACPVCHHLGQLLTRLREENVKLKNKNLGRLLADKDEEIERLREEKERLRSEEASVIDLLNTLARELAPLGMDVTPQPTNLRECVAALSSAAWRRVDAARAALEKRND